VKLKIWCFCIKTVFSKLDMGVYFFIYIKSCSFITMMHVIYVCFYLVCLSCLSIVNFNAI